MFLVVINFVFIVVITLVGILPVITRRPLEREPDLTRGVREDHRDLARASQRSGELDAAFGHLGDGDLGHARWDLVIGTEIADTENSTVDRDHARGNGVDRPVDVPVGVTAQDHGAQIAAGVHDIGAHLRVVLDSRVEPMKGKHTRPVLGKLDPVEADEPVVCANQHRS